MAQSQHKNQQTANRAENWESVELRARSQE